MAKQRSGFVSALGVLFALFKLLMDEVLAAGGTDDDLRQALNDATARKDIVEIILAHRRLAHRQLAQWKDFYKKYFNIKLDIDIFQLPVQKPGFERLIVVAKGLTLNRVYDVLAKHFPCWRYAEDLDTAVSINDRDPKNGGYAIWVRNSVEADEELKNLSADQLKEQGALGVTILERMLYELKYWDETDEHLDVQNWTLCSGSRNSDGNVPIAHWRVGKFKVNWYDSYYHSDNLRSRAAVPLPATQAV